MTNHGQTDADSPSSRPQVWEAQRLSSLIADVGEAGLRDILRLFMADLEFLQARLVEAIAARNERAAHTVMSAVLDSAEALGLLALSALVRRLRETPLDPSNPVLLAQEAARIRFVPSFKHAS